VTEPSLLAPRACDEAGVKQGRNVGLEPELSWLNLHPVCAREWNFIAFKAIAD